MAGKFYHGAIAPADLAEALLAEFNRGNMRAQTIGDADDVAVQIATRRGSRSGGSTALTITITKAPDGVVIEAGNQAWLGTAASLGQTTIATLANPWNLLHRLDDLAQDVENLQLTERAWQVIERTTCAAGVNFELSERLRRLVCEYCGTANPVGEAGCVACGAPLGKAQPGTCPKCGFVVTPTERICPNCGEGLHA
jgi:hypothetical protein